MFKRIDQSSFLIRALEWLSNFLAKRRGLPVVVGLIIFIVGGVFQFANIWLDSLILEVLYVLCHNLGIVIGVVGLLLAEPLGK